jgi:hypothetical protein
MYEWSRHPKFDLQCRNSISSAEIRSPVCVIFHRMRMIEADFLRVRAFADLRGVLLSSGHNRARIRRNEAEEVIDDATAGCGDLDLLGLHEEMLGGTFSCSHVEAAYCNARRVQASPRTKVHPNGNSPPLLLARTSRPGQTRRERRSAATRAFFTSRKRRSCSP